jgi:hypothetical protein
MMESVNLTKVVSTYVNITMYSPVQLLYVNKNEYRWVQPAETLGFDQKPKPKNSRGEFLQAKKGAEIQAKKA